MDIISHGLIGRALSISPKKDKKRTFWIVLFSFISDIPQIPIYIYLGYINYRFMWIAQNNDWIGFRTLHPILALLDDIPHSIFFALLIILPVILIFKLPKIAFVGYVFHLLLDLFTHSGEWARKPFYPFNYEVQGFANSWAWPWWGFLISWIVIIIIIVIGEYAVNNSNRKN